MYVKKELEMSDKHNEWNEENELDLTNNESSKKAVWTFFIIVLIIGLSYWGWQALSTNNSQIQQPAQEQTDPVALYDSYQDKIDQIMTQVPKDPDHNKTVNIIKQLVDLQNEVTSNKEQLKLPDGSYANYDKLQAKLTEEIKANRKKIIDDYDSQYNYASVDFETADQYSVEKGLGVMTNLINEIKADEKIVNVFPTEQAREQYIHMAQDKYDKFAKRAEEMKAQNN